jgi:hypothetical protein
MAMSSRQHRHRILVFAMIFGCTSASRLEAQAAATPKWEVEIHAGYGTGTNSTGGSGELPPGQGQFPIPGTSRSSHIVPSWFFGTGPIYINGSIGSAGSTVRLADIERALTSMAAAERRNGLAFGGRVVRSFTRALAVEASVEYQPGGLRISRENLGVLRTAEASFTPAWSFLFNRAPNLVAPASAATLSVADGGGAQIVTSAAIHFNLQPRGRVTPYLLLGGSLAAHRGTTTATLTGSYSFRGGGTIPIEQRDIVTIRYEPGDATLMATFGGGLRIDWSRDWGLRTDVRVHAGRDQRRVVLDARPETSPASPTGAVVVEMLRAFSFSTDPAVRSTLSGTVEGFEVFRSSGVDARARVTIGVFRRF